MSDALDRGITVTEFAPIDEPIEVAPETVAAFVGRTLRGPLNEPILIHNFGEFRRRFGDVWTRSSLGPAARQFFAHGGKNLYIVRVANDARGAMICLPAGGSALVLRAVEPGSTERIRAAVDFDRIDAGLDSFFNLTLHRVDPATGLVADQELHRNLSFDESHDNFVGNALMSSTIARVEAPYPTHLPEATGPSTMARSSAYAEHVQDGSDGHELSDYDLIGSRKYRTGLFALEAIDRLDLLYLPPPGKGRDIGPASLMAAELYCRKRRAMLVVDPHCDWVTPGKAVTGLRTLGINSANAIGYFPRMYVRDDDKLPRGVGAALAGLFCKLDRKYGPWSDLDQSGIEFLRELVPAYVTSEAESRTLGREGLNTIVTGPAKRAWMSGSYTLGRGYESQRHMASLPTRRLVLRIVNDIERSTRWGVFEKQGEQVETRIRAQVIAYLAALSNLGAFENDRFEVSCDSGRLNGGKKIERGLTVNISVQPVGCVQMLSFSLHQGVSGCRVTPAVFAPVPESYD